MRRDFDAVYNGKHRKSPYNYTKEPSTDGTACVTLLEKPSFWIITYTGSCLSRLQGGKILLVLP